MVSIFQARSADSGRDSCARGTQRHFAVISSKIRDAMRISVPILTKHSFFDVLAFRLDAPGEEILQETFEAVLNLIARM
jgi:hypothetical protein